MSQSGKFSPDIPAGKYIQQINGDTGTASGSVITFTGHPSAGSSVSFVASGSTVDLQVTDANGNTILGTSAGNAGISGATSVGLGTGVLEDLTLGSDLVMLGALAGNTLTTAADCVGVGYSAFGLGASTTTRSIGIGTNALFENNGSYNIALGYQAGSSYTAAESHNILFNNIGTGAESHVLRIGAGTGTGNGQLSNAFISGINGVNVGSVATVVSISGDHLGTATLTAGTNITITPGAGTITIAATAASGIQTINGNTGSVTGSTVTIQDTQGSAIFTGSVATMTHTYTDGKGNTVLGVGTNYASFVGTSAGANTAFGDANLASMTTGNQNTAYGTQCLDLLTTGSMNFAAGTSAGAFITSGSSNIFIGFQCGENLVTGSESSNILIGSNGVNADNNTIRIGNVTAGTGGNQNKCFICGINGITVSTADQMLVINSSDQIGSIAHGTSGQVLTSAGAGANPTWATPAAGFTWSVITANQTAAVNNGYICNKASTLALALPATAVVGSLLEVTGINTATGWQITQASGQQIFFGTSSTTSGAGGSLTSSATRDAVRLVCVVANTTWQVLSSIGNITVV